MNKIEIYSKDWCPFCSKAKSLLQSKQLDYAEVDITSDLAREQEMIERSGRRTVPQIFIDYSVQAIERIVDTHCTQ